LQALAGDRGIPLHVFPWTKGMKQAGLKRNAAYLIRPDGYIGMADRDGDASAISAYLSEKYLRSII
jgi:hypothetical protein